MAIQTTMAKLRLEVLILSNWTKNTMKIFFLATFSVYIKAGNIQILSWVSCNFKQAEILGS